MDGVTLNVRRGEVFDVRGQNGAGKTTTVGDCRRGLRTRTQDRPPAGRTSWRAPDGPSPARGEMGFAATVTAPWWSGWLRATVGHWSAGEAVEAPEPEFAGVECFHAAESCLPGVPPQRVRAHQGAGTYGVVMAE